MVRKPWWLAFVLGLCGCYSSGFVRERLDMRLHEEADKITDVDIKQIQTLKPQLHFPCRIAVALKAGSGSWRWTPKDRQVMDAWGESLRKEGIASDVIFMSTMFMHGDSLQELRASAAKYGADALLLIKGAAEVESYQNPAAVFNVTVVGGYLIPGSHRDALFLIEAGLIDVNNGFLYASMEAEGEGHTLAPTFIIEEKNAIERAKTEAIAAFGPELLLRLRNLRGGLGQAGPPLVRGGEQPAPR